MSRLTRRAVIGGFLAAAGGVTLRSFAQGPGTQKAVDRDPARLETFSEWFRASRAERRSALQPCLDWIRAVDPGIQAWKQVAPQRPTGDGPLAEIPFGVKDIIETKGLSTEYGSAIYKGRIGTEDAAIVRLLRERGGILLGKTNTTAFAYREPSPARNPRNPEHTPGGSSSGSAAAVAAGMVPVAIGTQTRGSVLRPASYCGVTGFKTTFGLLPMEGVLPYAKSFDTLGFFTHTAADMLAFWGALGRTTGQPEDFAFAAVEPVPEVDPEMRAAFVATLHRLRRAGVTIRSVDIAGLLVALEAATRIISVYEGARFHAERYKEFGARMGPMGELVRDGLLLTEQQYEEARRIVADGRTRVAEIYPSTPVILVPAAPGPAPKGLSNTGDPRMNAPWTALGTPAISIPMAAGSALPLGLQLTAAQQQDARLIQAAVKLERILA
jgi:Asp-tRNA(Asn)/Glu-tRNA(Gln) amidotransferase A subunit family amidase